MQGVITSKAAPPPPAVNEYGVPYEDVLAGIRAAHKQHVKALKAALAAWLSYSRAKTQAKKVGRCRKAKELTERALS